MIEDDDRADTYAKVFQIGTAQVSIDYYANEPRPGPAWIFTVQRGGVKRIYKYTLRPQHEEEIQSCTTDELRARFLLRHVRAAEPVKTIKLGGNDEPSGPVDKR